MICYLSMRKTAWGKLRSLIMLPMALELLRKPIMDWPELPYADQMKRDTQWNTSLGFVKVHESLPRVLSVLSSVG